MTIEQRLTDALHEVDQYQPSVDLFARTSRSIDEDRAHRRRLGWVVAWAALGVAALVVFFVAVSERDAGVLVVPTWSVVMAQVLIATALLLVLGPVIRRFGQPFITGAFHISPATGTRFSKVLDIAYYLFFTGLIVVIVGIGDRGDFVAIPSGLRNPYLDQLGAFLLVMGIAHVLNLLAIPVAGLIFGAMTRRVIRHRLGRAAPPEAPKARMADRVATWITYIAAAMILFQLVGLVLTAVGGLSE